MAKGFRGSLFGFKKSDVINYIENANKGYAENQEALKEKIEELELQIANLTDDIKALEEEKERLNNIQESNVRRYEEIEKLSEEIGQLYVNAKIEAKEIVADALTQRDNLNEEIKGKISAINEANEKFAKIKSDFEVSLNTFSKALDDISDSAQLLQSTQDDEE